MKQSTKDNLLYLGIAGTVAAALAFYVFYTAITMGTIPDIPGPILWGILSTPVVVGLILERYWEYRRRRSLWIVSTIAALINVSAMLIAYSFRWNPPVIVWSMMTVLGVIVVFIVAEKFVARNRSG